MNRRCPTCFGVDCLAAARLRRRPLFRAFVKVADHCEKCGEPLRYHRADDFPAYLVIVLVGHIVVPLAMWVEIAYSAGLLGARRDVGPLILGLALGLLQPSRARS